MVQQGGRAHRFGAQYAQDVTATSIKTTSYPVHRFGTQCAFTVHLTRSSRVFFLFEHFFLENWRKD
jgi:hypothetical protein